MTGPVALERCRPGCIRGRVDPHLGECVVEYVVNLDDDR